ADVSAIESKMQTLSHVAVGGPPALMTMLGRGETVRLQGISVGPGIFDLLGGAPLLGRTISRTDGAPGAEGVIVLSYGVWRRNFDADPNVVGQTIRLADSLAGPNQSAAKTFTIVGVMPDDFVFGGTQVQFWIPNPRGSGRLLGRLAPGATAAAAST